MAQGFINGGSTFALNAGGMVVHASHDDTRVQGGTDISRIISSSENFRAAGLALVNSLRTEPGSREAYATTLRETGDRLKATQAAIAASGISPEISNLVAIHEQNRTGIEGANGLLANVSGGQTTTLTAQQDAGRQNVAAPAPITAPTVVRT